MNLKTYKKTIKTYTDDELKFFVNLWGQVSEQEDGGVPMKTQLAEQELERRRDERRKRTYVDETMPTHVRPELR